jgi:hypothetical protein
MGFLETDQDYLDAGVEPPEHTPHSGSEGVVFDKHIHRWKQIGGHIECDGGQHIHGQGFDHMTQILVGTSPEGQPVFKTLDLEPKKPDDSATSDARA